MQSFNELAYAQMQGGLNTQKENYMMSVTVTFDRIDDKHIFMKAGCAGQWIIHNKKELQKAVNELLEKEGSAILDMKGPYSRQTPRATADDGCESEMNNLAKGPAVP